MTRNEYDNFLARANISQKDIKILFERVLTREEDILKYLDHVRVFCREYGIRVSVDKELALQFMRALVSALIRWRTNIKYKGDETVFNQYLPEPSRDSIYESWRHKDNQEREFRYRSGYRRGFYINGIENATCGKDLQNSLLIYEYETKRKKT